ncbi:MAG TPA: HNH endonuclease signature motif containing protein [Candidimonas sp.]|nr:HNH endonuclease signature motif containing protein [Candidimonas sp.]
MNYSKIYDDFIEDRRKKEFRLIESGEYRERHHIVPRCLGGTDDPSNLITVTPEDHFFAHLLLAKMHGGKLWAPIAFMVGGTRKDYKPTHSRVKHGWAARAMAKSLTGELSYQFDFAEYELDHIDGRSWAGRQSEMPEALGISKSLANMLIKGRVSVAKGWHLSGRPPKERGGESHPMYRDETLVFLNIDGRTFSGTRFDFNRIHGVDRPAITGILKGQTRKGWHLPGVKPRLTGKDYRFANAVRVMSAAEARQKFLEMPKSPTTDYRIHTFAEVASSRIFKCTRTEMRLMYGIKESTANALFRRNKSAITHGIKLLQEGLA